MNFILSGSKVLYFILICSLVTLVAILFFFEFGMLERVLLPFFISLFFSLGIFFVLNLVCKDKFCSKIYLVSVLLHFIFILFWQLFKYHMLGYQLPTENTFKAFIVDNDGGLYHLLGVYISQHYTIETLMEKFAGGWFPKLVGTIYYVLGINPFLVSCINAIISGFTALILFLIGKCVLQNRYYAKVFSFLSILNFAHIINTSTMIRDNYIVLFMYLSILLSYYFYKTRTILSLCLTALSLYLLYLLRPYAAIVILLAIIVTFVFVNLKVKTQNNTLKVNKLSLLLILCLPLIVAIFVFILIKFSELFKVISVEDLIDIRETAYQTGAGEIPIDFGALYSKFFLLPFIVGYLYLFFAPFPWEWIYPRRMIYVPDMLILYCFLPSFFKNIKKVLVERNYLLVVSLFSIIFMFSIYCITLGSTGAIHRLRGPFIPMIYLIAFYRPNQFLSKIIRQISNWRII